MRKTVIAAVLLALSTLACGDKNPNGPSGLPSPSPSPIVVASPTPPPAPAVYASIDVCARKNGICVTDWHPGDAIRLEAKATCATGTDPSDVHQVDCPPFKNWIWERDLSDLSTQSRWEGQLFSNIVIVICDGVGTFRTVVQPQLWDDTLLDKSQIFVGGVR